MGVTTPIKTVMAVAIIGVIAAVVLPMYSAKHNKADDEAKAKSVESVLNPFPASAVPSADAIDTAKQIALSTPAGQIAQAVVKPKPRPKLEPRFETVTRRVCEPKTVTVEVDIPDLVKPVERSAIGMLLGGAAGALLGNQIGGGNGKTIATVAGAAGGAYAGDRMANSSEQAKPGTHKEQRSQQVEVCHDVTEQIRVK